MDTDQNVSPTAAAEAPSSAPVLRRVRPAWLAIAILIAAILAESVLLLRINNPEDKRNDVLNVSRRFLVLLTTYNASTLAQQRRDVLALATGRFKTEFNDLTGDAFAKALTETKADSRGHIQSVAVVSVSGDNASVLALVDVTVTNKDLKTPRTEHNVIELSLVHTSSGWRIDAVTVDGKIT